MKRILTLVALLSALPAFAETRQFRVDALEVTRMRFTRNDVVLIVQGTRKGTNVQCLIKDLRSGDFIGVNVWHDVQDIADQIIVTVGEDFDPSKIEATCFEVD